MGTALKVNPFEVASHATGIVETKQSNTPIRKCVKSAVRQERQEDHSTYAQRWLLEL